LLAEIRSKVEIPLVLHGGSGLSKDDFQNAIAKGINKINFFTECSLEAVQAARAVLATGTPMSYPDLIATTKSRVREVVAKQIQIFGTRPLK
jgi:fructose-bisphosphate aldolase class II